MHEQVTEVGHVSPTQGMNSSSCYEVKNKTHPNEKPTFSRSIFELEVHIPAC